MNSFVNFLVAILCYQLGILFAPLWATVLLELWFIASLLHWFFSSSHRWPAQRYIRTMYTLWLPLGLVVTLTEFFDTGKIRFK
jgi:hypothetical protein